MAAASERRATIRQVAKEASVSIATVSRVLNGLSSVDADLAERVRVAADQLNYRPNAVAQALTRGTTSTIGVVVPDLANPYFNQILKHMEAAAAESSYRLLVADSDQTLDEELPLCRELLRQVDGLILVSPRMRPAEVRRLLAERMPVVWINRLIRGIELPAVAVDSYRAMQALRRHLEELGHRRAVYLAGPQLSWSQRQRWRALRSPSPEGLCTTSVLAGNTMDEGYGAVDAALEHAPSVLVCFNDLVAFGALARLTELGVRVPQHMSVTGFDDIPFAPFVSPPLTTTTSPAAEVGRASWELFMKARTEASLAEVVWFSPAVVYRKSAAPPAAR